MIELLVGRGLGLGQIPQDVFVNPAAAGHDHGPGLDPKEFAPLGINDIDMFGRFGLALVLNARHGRLQAEAHRLAGPIQGLPVDGPAQHLLERLASYGGRDHGLHKVPRRAGVAPRPTDQGQLADLRGVDAPGLVILVGVGANARQVKVKSGVGGDLIAAQAAPGDGEGLVNKRHDLRGAIQFLGDEIAIGHGIQPLLPAFPPGRVIVMIQAQQVLFHLVGQGRLLEVVAPRVNHPLSARRGVEEKAGGGAGALAVHGGVMIPGHGQVQARAGHLLKFKRRRQAQLMPIAMKQTVLFGDFRRPHHAI